MKIYGLIIFCYAIIINGCSPSLGVNFSTRKLDQLEVGKTKKQFVDKEFQRPYLSEKVSTNKLESVIYYYYYGAGITIKLDKKELYMEFINNTLNGILFNYTFDNDYDFNMTLKNRLVLHESKKNEIIKLLGNNNGEVLLPTNLLSRIIKNGNTIDYPKNANKVLIYYNSFIKKIPFTLNDYVNRTKYLLLFLDVDDVLIKIDSGELDIK